MSMEISFTKDLPAGYTPTTSAQKTEVDYNSFLRLLVAQMKNQDPTNPMDSTQYVAQLASFSQVEQSVQMNNKLDQILQGSALSQAGDLIGNQITSADGTRTGIDRLCGAAGGEQFDAALGQRARQVDQSGLVRHRQQRPSQRHEVGRRDLLGLDGHADPRRLWRE